MPFYDVVILYEDGFEESKAGKDRGQMIVRRTLLAKSSTPNPNFLEIATSTQTWQGLYGSRIPQLDDEVTFSGYPIKFKCSSRQFSWYDGSDNGVQIDLTFEGLSSYINNDGGGSRQPNQSNSQTWRRVSLSTSQISVPASDRNGLPFCNSAGDPVDGLEEESSLAVLTYTNNFVPDPNLVAVWSWLNYCNEYPYLGANPYTLRVTGFNAEFDDGQMLWKCSVELTYNPKGWMLKYYDVGYNEIVNGERKAILDKFGNPVSQPVPLDGNGGQAAPSVPPKQKVLNDSRLNHFFALSELVSLDAQPYPVRDFSPLLLNLRIA